MKENKLTTWDVFIIMWYISVIVYVFGSSFIMYDLKTQLDACESYTNTTSMLSKGTTLDECGTIAVNGTYVALTSKCFDITKEEPIEINCSNEINFDCEQRIASYQIYEGIPQNTSWGVNGLYWSDKGYYCVNVIDNDNVTRTEVHEQCHALIHNNRKHMCEDW